MENNKELTFECTAPGKIIISGEHAVVYNSKALSCAINLLTCCKMKITPTSTKILIIEDDKFLKLDFHSLDQHIRVEKDRLNHLKIFKETFIEKKYIEESLDKTIDNLLSETIFVFISK